MSSVDRTLPILRRSLTVYLDGASGIRYEALLEFAQPLFELFQVDPRDLQRSGPVREANELATLISTLDLARLFWAYFMLDGAELYRARSELSRVMLGPSPSRSDAAALDELIGILADRWVAAASEEPSPEMEGYLLPGFDALLTEYVRAHASDDNFGASPEAAADRPDALATFARPLFDNADLADPASVDDALARAQAYWDLAQTPNPAYERKLENIALRFTRAGRSTEAVRIEADAMSRRYRDLFGS